MESGHRYNYITLIPTYGLISSRCTLGLGKHHRLGCCLPIKLLLNLVIDITLIPIIPMV